MSAIAWSTAHDSTIDTGEHDTVLRSRCGRVIPLPSARWWRAPLEEDERVLDMAVAPVLDLGCGPGRLTVALARRGLAALGVDSSAAAVVAARDKGAAVVQRSVFDPLPDEGRWGSVLLLDGNIAFSVPMLLGWGAQADNPSFLPRNYAFGVAIVLAVVWVVATAMAITRSRRR